MKRLLVLVCVVVGAGLCGCGRPFYVTVDALSSPAADPKRTYALLPAMQNVSLSDLQFHEFAAYLRRALNANGFQECADPNTCEVVVFVAYGIGPPQEQFATYSIPVWGQTGVSSSTTHGTFFSHGGMGTYSGTTTYTPQYGIVGYNTGVTRHVTHDRHLGLWAVDLDTYRRTGEIAELWRVGVASTGASGDLRGVFPMMVAAAAPYLGQNTSGQVNVTIWENDEKVRAIRGETPDSKR